MPITFEEVSLPLRVQYAINTCMHTTSTDASVSPIGFGYEVARTTLGASGRQEFIDALENLLEAIPRQTSDADWWPDELTKAVFEAKRVIEVFDPEEAVNV